MFTANQFCEKKSFFWGCQKWLLCKGRHKVIPVSSCCHCAAQTYSFEGDRELMENNYARTKISYGERKTWRNHEESFNYIAILWLKFQWCIVKWLLVFNIIFLFKNLPDRKLSLPYFHLPPQTPVHCGRSWRSWRHWNRWRGCSCYLKGESSTGKKGRHPTWTRDVKQYEWTDNCVTSSAKLLTSHDRSLTDSVEDAVLFVDGDLFGCSGLIFEHIRIDPNRNVNSVQQPQLDLCARHNNIYE